VREGRVLALRRLLLSVCAFLRLRNELVVDKFIVGSAGYDLATMNSTTAPFINCTFGDSRAKSTEPATQFVDRPHTGKAEDA